MPQIIREFGVKQPLKRAVLDDPLDDAAVTMLAWARVPTAP